MLVHTVFEAFLALVLIIAAGFVGVRNDWIFRAFLIDIACRVSSSKVARLNQRQALDKTMNCAQCCIPMRKPTASNFCDVCDSILDSLLGSTTIAAWFIEASNEDLRATNRAMREKAELMGLNPDTGEFE